MNFINTNFRELNREQRPHSQEPSYYLPSNQLPPPPTHKMIDGFFNDARLKLISKSKISSLYCSLKMITLISLSFYLRSNLIDIPYLTPLALGIIVNLLMVFIHIRTICRANNLKATLDVASLLHHCVQQPIPVNEQNNTTNSIENRVSTTYDSQNNIQSYQQEIIDKFSNLVDSTYKLLALEINCLNLVARIMSMIFIFTLISALWKYSCSLPTKIISIIILILEIISRLDLIICLLILSIIIPLIMILFCIICCCGQCCLQQLRTTFPSIRLGQPQPFQIQNYPQLSVIQFQANTLLETTTNECNICFQNFSIGDKILILPCNNKHVFHQFCITTWFRASETCPLCRKSVREMVGGREEGGISP